MPQVNVELILSAVWDSLNDAMIITDVNGKLFNVNNAFCLLTGFDKKSLIGKSFNVVYSKNEQAEILSDYFNNISGSTFPYSAEKKVTFFNGNQFYLEISNSLIEISGELYVMSIFHNVTERKRIEIELQHSEISYHGLFDTVEDAIYIQDKDSRFLNVNQGVVRMYGYPHDWFIGKTPLDLAAPGKNDFEKIMIQIHDALNGKPQVLEFWGQRRNGEIFPKEVRLYRGLYFGQEVLITIAIDITERKRAEGALVVSESNLQALINNENESIWSLDNNYNLIICNNCFRNAYFAAYNIEIKVGINLVNILSPELRTFWKPKYDTVLSGEKISFEFDETIQGNHLYFNVFLNPIISEGKVTGVSALSIDITKHKQAVEALRESEYLLRDSQTIAGLGSYVLDIQTGLWKSSEMLDKVFGIDEGYEHSLEGWAALIHPDDRALMDDYFKKEVLGKRQKFNKEYRIIRHDDQAVRWLHGLGKLEFDAQGRLMKMHGTIQDITERKQAGEALKISEQKYRELVENALIGIYTVTEDGTMLYVNDALWKMLEYESADDIIKYNSQSFYKNKNDRVRFIEDIKRTGRIINRETELITKTGKTRNVILNTYLAEDKITGMVLDVTSQKLEHDNLVRLNKAIENSREIVLITDRRGIITFINPMFTKMYGYSAEEVTGKATPRILKSGLMSDEQYKQFWYSLINKQSLFSEFVNKDKYGNLINVEVSADPILDEKGDILGFLGIQRDITDRIKAKEELIKAKEKAELSNKLKDAFIANISHEIRTPLNGILGMTGLIHNSLSKYIHNKEKNYFTAIDRASVRIIRTIDMILNFSRLQVGDFPVSPEKINISPIIKNLIKEYKTKADEKSIKLSFENKSGDAVVTIDEYCITQAISNLVDNAVKYTVTGDVKLVLYTDSENELKLDIQDTGIGISEDYIPQIFEPYTQEEIGYNRGYEGVGLGMSLVKKYLDLNGADITVISKKDKGTLFTVHFNKFKIKKTGKVFAEFKLQEPIKFIPEDKRKSRKKPRILIVEDDGINQFYILTLLNKDFETASAFSADSALEIMKSQTPDLILMDISLKGSMNGLDLTKLLKESNYYKDIPVIAVTGNASAEDKQNCLNAGCNEYLSKPFSDRELLEKILKFVVKEK